MLSNSTDVQGCMWEKRWLPKTEWHCWLPKCHWHLLFYLHPICSILPPKYTRSLHLYSQDSVQSRSSSSSSGTSHILCKAPSLIPSMLVPHTYSRVHRGGGQGAGRCSLQFIYPLAFLFLLFVAKLTSQPMANIQNTICCCLLHTKLPTSDISLQMQTVTFFLHI